MIQCPINTNPSLNKLVEALLKRGGHVNKYYLTDLNKNKHAVVFLDSWFGGKNIREALIKALA